MQENLFAYIPMDRRHALAQRIPLRDRTTGAALFADISGFTPLTEALVRELGRQRGAEELTRYLNLVYDALIDELHRFGGSAIAFAGDAITCWFEADPGARATASALAMQRAMAAFAAITTPFGHTVSLSMKAAVAVGAARRFLVGDPQIRVLDALAGSTLERLAAGEHLAAKGEVMLDAATMAGLAGAVEIAELRHDEQGRAFGVCVALAEEASPAPWPELPPDALDEDQVRPWLLPPVYARLRQGMGEFLAELRPTVALFIRFTGIDYDGDDAAGAKLDAYVRWIQQVLEHYKGTLIDLNIGDKGSYIYINFGAPLAHEDNTARAAAAALELRKPPPELEFIEPVQIGISQGRMRAGAYGGAMHRTYGVLGDEVNMAARLMMAAKPGQILVSQAAQRWIQDNFRWEALPPIRVKGKSEPVTLFALEDVQQRGAMHLPQPGQMAPMVGRQAELAQALQQLALAREGQGQILSIMGETGLGKSRLVAEIVHQAAQRGFLSYGGECEATGLNTSYLVWQPIWRSLFGLEGEHAGTDQLARLERRVAAISPALVRRVPLLSAVLNFAIPDNDLTRSFDAKLRKTSLEGLLAECLRALAQDQPLLLVLEDCHWLDPLSHDLLVELGNAIADLPVLIVIASRAYELERLKAARVSAYPYHSEIVLHELTPAELSELAHTRLETLTAGRPHAASAHALIARIVEQAEGNPFYVEELINFIRYNGIDPTDPYAVGQLELPSSLQGLVLSRVDQLNEREKTTLKVASVIGRVFRAPWLWGAYPDLGDPDAVRSDLIHLSDQELTAPDPAEAELTYFFKHIITQQVVYESLLHMVRTALHEQIADHLERAYPERRRQLLDLLAYHYDLSANDGKRRHFLRLAGEAAQGAYANEAAIDYYRRVLPLLAAAEQVDVMLKLAEVERLVGHWEEAGRLYVEAQTLAEGLNNRTARAWCLTNIGELHRMQADYTAAVAQFEQARAEFEAVGDARGVAQTLHYAGNVAVQQGDYEAARVRYDESLAIRRSLGDEAGVARLLNNLAIIAEYQQDYATAHQVNLESLAIRRKLGERAWIAYSLNNLANVVAAQGDHATARGYLEEAVALQREIGDRWGLANALGNLANVARTQGDYVTAKALYTESLTIHRSLGDKWAIGELLQDIACLAVMQGNYDRGLRLLGAAEQLRDDIGAALPPNDQERLNRIFAPAYDSLGEAMDPLIAEGRAMAVGDAIDYALV
jgi:class 3 adenylate cyclase/tetratricopeptide (TPR) repeat protein